MFLVWIFNCLGGFGCVRGVGDWLFVFGRLVCLLLVYVVGLVHCYVFGFGSLCLTGLGYYSC